jgi:hypothetical protein
MSLQSFYRLYFCDILGMESSSPVFIYENNLKIFINYPISDRNV